MLSTLRCFRTIIAQPRFTSSSVHTLQAAFKDPSSPFYLAPGTEGPASPDSPPTVSHDSPNPVAVAYFHSSSSINSESPPPHATSAAPASSPRPHKAAHPFSLDLKVLSGLTIPEAKDALVDLGYDEGSFWEQKVVWGDMDSFQHVNNVQYLRFLESSRIAYLSAIGHSIGGPKHAENMLKGIGVSLILKSIDLDFKRPVTYPDTLLISHKPLPHPKSEAGEHAPQQRSRTSLPFHALIYSAAHRCPVLTSSSLCVWYDYSPSKLSKCDPGEEVWDILRKRIVSRD